MFALLAVPLTAVAVVIALVIALVIAVAIALVGLAPSLTVQPEPRRGQIFPESQARAYRRRGNAPFLAGPYWPTIRWIPASGGQLAMAPL